MPILTPFPFPGLRAVCGVPLKLDTWHLTLTIRHPPFAIRQSQPVICHSQFATRLSPLATCHSPLATYHLPLATCHTHFFQVLVRDLMAYNRLLDGKPMHELDVNGRAYCGCGASFCMTLERKMVRDATRSAKSVIDSFRS